MAQVQAMQVAPLHQQLVQIRRLQPLLTPATAMRALRGASGKLKAVWSAAREVQGARRAPPSRLTRGLRSDGRS